MDRLYAWDKPVIYTVIFISLDHYYYKNVETLNFRCLAILMARHVDELIYYFSCICRGITTLAQ